MAILLPPHSYPSPLMGEGYDVGMMPSDFPARRCREGVQNQVGSFYVCELPDLHMGPHSSQSVQTSVRVRETWERENPALASAQHSSEDIIDMKGPQ